MRPLAIETDSAPAATSLLDRRSTFLLSILGVINGISVWSGIGGLRTHWPLANHLLVLGCALLIVVSAFRLHVLKRQLSWQGRWYRPALAIGCGMSFPIMLLLAFLLVLWTPGIWTGVDPMFEPRQEVQHGWSRFVVVRENAAAFEPFRIHVRQETPVVPWVMYWSRTVITARRASDANLAIKGDTLLCTFPATVSGPEETIRFQLR